MPNKKKNHNFWEFFVLVKNDTNKSNAKAVCICCMQKVGGLAIAQITSGCFTSNKANKKETHRLHLSTPIVNNHEIYESNDRG